MSDIEEKVYQYLTTRSGSILPSVCARDLGLPLESVRQALLNLSRQGRIRRQIHRTEKELKNLATDRSRIQSELTGLPGRVASGELTLPEYEIRRGTLNQHLAAIDKELLAGTASVTDKIKIAVKPGIKPEAVADLLNERDRISKWLENLNTRKDSVSENIYLQIKSEYESKLTAIKGSLSDSLNGLHKLLEYYQQQQNQLSYEIENIEARHFSGEMDDKTYRSGKSDMENVARQSAKEIQIIQDILKRMD